MQEKLELMLGPMKSNKTAELLRRADMRCHYAGQYVMFFKPNDEANGAPGTIESRNPLGCGKMEAVEFKPDDPWSIFPLIAKKQYEIGKRVDCIAVDEGHFVKDLFRFTRSLLDAGYDVLVAGLDLDFRGLPFGEMINLTWLVDTYGGNVTRCIAYCDCGDQARYSQRLIGGKPVPYDSPIHMSGDSYEPRCADHFVLPGRPH